MTDRKNRDCAECSRLEDEAVQVLETNVDPLDRNSSSYVSAMKDGRERCSTHGTPFYKRFFAGKTSTALLIAATHRGPSK